MTRNEDDLRDALRELEQRADRQGAPFTAKSILGTSSEDHLGRGAARRRATRWLPPLAAAVLVAAATITAVTLSSRHSGSSHSHDPQAGSPPTGAHTAAPSTAASHPASTAASHQAAAHPNTSTPAAAILDTAAGALAAGSTWATPAPDDFFYVRTTEATTWTSVSGTRAGEGRTTDGTKISVPGCRGGQIVSAGESGTCTLNDVSHYLGDAPTAPAAWDAYLEQMAPGAKAAQAQGKIIVQVLHEDLVAPKAAAALLRYTADCSGLHTVAVGPVDGEKLIGVTCTSMTNGSYGLAFDARSHTFVGFVPVAGSGRQDSPAEIVRRTGIVTTVGRTP